MPAPSRIVPVERGGDVADRDAVAGEHEDPLDQLGLCGVDDQLVALGSIAERRPASEVASRLGYGLDLATGGQPSNDVSLGLLAGGVQHGPREAISVALPIRAVGVEDLDSGVGERPLDQQGHERVPG
jgi:hypothetical protein